MTRGKGIVGRVFDEQIALESLVAGSYSFDDMFNCDLTRQGGYTHCRKYHKARQSPFVHQQKRQAQRKPDKAVIPRGGDKYHKPVEELGVSLGKPHKRLVVPGLDSFKHIFHRP